MDRMYSDAHVISKSEKDKLGSMGHNLGRSYKPIMWKGF